MLCLNHKVSKFTASHNSNLSHDWNDIQVIIDRRPLRDFVARAPTSRSACGGALQNEISHAERAFSLLLAGGALAHDMKLTAGGRELHDVCGEDEIRTRGTVNPYVSLANWWFQPLTHLSGNAFLREIR